MIRISVIDMDKTTLNTIDGLIIIIMGSLFTIFHKQIAHRTMVFYYNLIHTKFSENGYQMIFLVIGLAFTILGLLSIFQIINFR